MEKRFIYLLENETELEKELRLLNEQIKKEEKQAEIKKYLHEFKEFINSNNQIILLNSQIIYYNALIDEIIRESEKKSIDEYNKLILEKARKREMSKKTSKSQLNKEEREKY